MYQLEMYRNYVALFRLYVSFGNSSNECSHWKRGAYLHYQIRRVQDYKSQIEGHAENHGKYGYGEGFLFSLGHSHSIREVGGTPASPREV